MENSFVSLNQTQSKSSLAKAIAITALAVFGTMALCLMVSSSSHATGSDSQLLIQDPHVNQLYKEWKLNFSKTFGPHEDKIRAQIFFENHKKIETHNADKSHTWIQGYGPFTALTPEEFHALHLKMTSFHEKQQEDENRVHHREENSTVEKNQTHHTHHNRTEIRHKNGTDVIIHNTTVHHPNRSQIVNFNRVHVAGGRVVFYQSHSHETQNVNLYESLPTVFLHKHSHHMENDTHTISLNRVNVTLINGEFIHRHSENHTNNQNGTEIKRQRHHRSHPNGTEEHENHTHIIAPVHNENQTIFHHETHEFHQNGTHTVHHNDTRVHHNGTVVTNKNTTYHHPDGAISIFQSETTFGDINVDWTQRGIITPVKSQGSCGGCYAFSAIAGIESALAQANRGKIQLSEQMIIDCGRGQPGIGGCEGGGVPAVWDWVKGHGVTTQGNYPFEMKDNNCRRGNGEYKVAGYTRVSPQNNVGVAQQALAGHPLEIGLWVDGWQNYKGGVLGACSGQTGMHAVQIVGASGGVWKIKNSWGTGWGEGGFIRLAPGNTCSVTRDTQFVWV